MADITVHPIPPLFDENSKILILGSFPSVKSREHTFFYAHPQNRFWRVISEIFSAPTPKTVEEKKRLLITNNIALWDVIASCEIIGSSDASIRNVSANNISVITSTANIKKIFVNGRTAEKYYKKLIEPTLQIPAQLLPSTSPANASISYPNLLDFWKKAILEAKHP